MSENPEFGARLRRLRRAAGMSLADLSKVVHYSKSYLSKVECGLKPPTADLAERCDRALLADGELLELSPPRPAPALAARHRVLVPRQLPPPPRCFVARGVERSTLTEVLSQSDDPGGTAHRVALISGPAGVGKTALALQWAHEATALFPDGQLYVDLRGFASTESALPVGEVARGFLEALGVSAGLMPAEVDAQVGLYRSLLVSRRLLVVLDNARDADQVRPLLAGGGCAVLVTSRRRMVGLVAANGAEPIALGMFNGAEAVELLKARLGRARVLDEPDAVRELVALCAGLPLALNVAAAIVALHAQAAIGSQVRGMRQVDRLDAFATGDEAADVRAVFSWSYQALSAEAARLFPLLSRHPGPDISLAAAASLFADGQGKTRRVLTELVDAHLVIPVGIGRYAMHDLLRAYAVELACDTREPDELRAATTRLLDHYLHTGQSATGLLRQNWVPAADGPPASGVIAERIADGDAAVAWFDIEYHNLLAIAGHAVNSGRDDHAWQLVWMLVTYLDRASHWHELADLAHRALAAATRAIDPLATAATRRALARARLRLGDLDDCQDLLALALGEYERHGAAIGRAQTHHELALVCEQRLAYTDACAHARTALALFETDGTDAMRANALNTLGWFLALTGDLEHGLQRCQTALDLHRDLRDPAGMAGTWDSVGYILHLSDRGAEAVAAYGHAVEQYEQVGDRYYAAGTLVRLGDAHCAQGDLPSAVDTWRAALRILDVLDHPDSETVEAKIRQAVGE